VRPSDGNTAGFAGDVLSAQGDLAGALQAYRKSLAVAQELVAADPTYTRWQRQLSAGQLGVGDVLRAQGDLAGVLPTAYQLVRNLHTKLHTSA
jgi:hypothetical protein